MSLLQEPFFISIESNGGGREKLKHNLTNEFDRIKKRRNARRIIENQSIVTLATSEVVH